MDLDSVDLGKTQASQVRDTQEMDWDAIDFGELPTDLALSSCPAFEMQFENTTVPKPSESLRTPTQAGMYESMTQGPKADDTATSLEGSLYGGASKLRREGSYGKRNLPSPPSFSSRFSSAYHM